MGYLAIVSLFVLAAMASAQTTTSKVHYDINKAPELFEKYIKDYNKHYKNEADKEIHYHAFVKTLNFINKQNTPSSTAEFDINQFADRTEEEIHHMNGLHTVPPKHG